MSQFEPKFCQYCGKPLFMRYPAGDPENGPASLRCVDNSHGGPVDWKDEAIWESRDETIVEYLEKIQEGFREGPWEPVVPVWASKAASILLAHRHLEKVHAAKDYYEYQRQTWADAQWFGGSCDDLPPTRRQVYNHLIRKP